MLAQQLSNLKLEKNWLGNISDRVITVLTVKKNQKLKMIKQKELLKAEIYSAYTKQQWDLHSLA